MSYKPNPKLAGSGIVACIPQKGRCPHECPDCFFQSGRSYLEPLDENTPNIPSMIHDVGHRVVRVNDGNDSNVDREMVLLRTKKFPLRFYNTSYPIDLAGYEMPVVLTANPGRMVDNGFHLLGEIPANLMFVRALVNMWNLDIVDEIVSSFTSRNVPVVLTFMAYYQRSVTAGYDNCYVRRVRTQNEYSAISTHAWRGIMERYQDNLRVYSCGHIEGEDGDTKCKYCGSCLREYFATMERLSK